MTPLENQLREAYGRVTYTHKTHEKAADILLEHQKNIKLGQLVLSCITATGFLAGILGTGRVISALGLILSTILVALNTYSKKNDVARLAQEHRTCADNLWLIRERYISLLTDFRTGLALAEVQKQRDILVNQTSAVYKSAPRTDSKAYMRAQEALQVKEDMTFSEEELDKLLPPGLRSK